MTQCPDCPTYKKADNCIRCYREQKKQYLRLVSDLRLILATSAYHLLGEKIRLRLDREEA